MESVRSKQISLLMQMLNFNEPVSKNTNVEPVWKVLIYDKCGQDIISPLISIKQLRELGVTLHMQLHSDRDSIPDVPAIYFCMPSEENLMRISQDFLNGTYDEYHLNFISAISRQKLEDLASAALQSNVVSNIQKVFDQYLNFISLEEDFFVLKHQDIESISYQAINRGNIKDTEMDSIIDTTVDGLFCIFVTLGIIPIIRSPRGNAAEMVAEKLDKRLRENLRDTRNGLFLTESSNYSFQRPLLIILDRNMDMATPLHHTWTYQALAHDVLDLSLNRVVIGGDKKKICDLDCNDSFWNTHKGSPFPTVAEAIQEELEQLKTSSEEVKKLKSSMGLDNESDVVFSMMSDTTDKLTSAVSSLPQLLERKRLIDMHTNIATAILESIKSRRLDTLFEYEEKIMSRASIDRSMMDVINDPNAGTCDDKMRLFIIFYICSLNNMTEVEFDSYSSALQDQGCDLKPLKYIKRWKMYSNMATNTNEYEGGGTKTISMFSKLMSQGSSFVMEGVKNLVVKRHNLPVTRAVDALLEGREPTTPEGDYHYFDPKQLRRSDVTRSKTPTQEAIVFVVGTGNYIEYQNLMDYAKNKWTGIAGSTNSKKIIYGASVLANAKQFLKELSMLGQELE